MYEKEKLIPLAGLLIFVLAFVGLLWGDQIGWVEMLGRIPAYVMLGIVLLVLAGSWRFRPKALGLGRGTWLVLLLVLAVLAGWQYFSSLGNR